ncbi:MAG: HAD family hydrolase [Bacilli bacterium]|nr:HAD family hydrolase [Bacilli bacterium]
MYKRIIFDIDNTLIDWKSDNYNPIKKALDNQNISYTEEDLKNINTAIEDYEYKYDILTKKDMINLINKFSKKNLDLSFLNDYLNYIKDEKVEKDIKLIELLKYLKDKYELVILTNWFLEPQVKRLEKAGILEFFDKIYASDDYYLKPNENAFLRAIGNNGITECIIIGDNYDTDIEIPKALGMKTIYINKGSSNDSISSIYELKDIL